MIYIAAIVCTELDGLKKDKDPEVLKSTRLAN